MREIRNFISTGFHNLADGFGSLKFRIREYTPEQIEKNPEVLLSMLYSRCVEKTTHLSNRTQWSHLLTKEVVKPKRADGDMVKELFDKADYCREDLLRGPNPAREVETSDGYKIRVRYDRDARRLEEMREEQEPKPRLQIVFDSIVENAAMSRRSGIIDIMLAEHIEDVSYNMQIFFNRNTPEQRKFRGGNRLKRMSAEEAVLMDYFLTQVMA